MSSGTGSNNCSCSEADTMTTPYLGGSLLQVDDFFQYPSLLHPLAVGTIAILVLFAALRLSSNRTVAPMALFDWIVNVALGSTLAGIVNGNSLTRGLIGLATLLSFQYLTSYSSCRLGNYLGSILNSPPLVIVFRGRTLDQVMRKHRITTTDLHGALRGRSIWDVSQVEACILEPTGTFSIYRCADTPEEGHAEVLMAVPGYRALVEDLECRNENDKKENGGSGTSKSKTKSKRKSPARSDDGKGKDNSTESSDTVRASDEEEEHHADDGQKKDHTDKVDKGTGRDKEVEIRSAHSGERESNDGEHEEGTDEQNKIAQDAA